jgi:hypothetical protein
LEKKDDLYEKGDDITPFAGIFNLMIYVKFNLCTCFAGTAFSSPSS